MQYIAEYWTRSLDEIFCIASAMNEVTTQFPHVITKPKDKYVPLSTIKDWYNFYIVVSGIDRLMNIVTSESKLLSQDNTTKQTVGHLKNATSSLSAVLTIFAALEATFPNLKSRISMTLHFIGARTHEFQDLYSTEKLLHLLPVLKTLQLIFIGPDIDPQAVAQWGIGKATKYRHDCAPCSSNNRTITFTLWQGTYKCYIETSTYLSQILRWLFIPASRTPISSRNGVQP